MMRNPVVPLSTYQGLPILNPRFGAPYCYYVNYLRNNLLQLQGMSARHSKVLFFRFDVTFPEEYNGGEVRTEFFRFNNHYRQLLLERNVDPQYMIRQEQRLSEHPHFHVAMLLNGNLAQHPLFYKDWANALWREQLASTKRGLIDYCNNNGNPEGIMIVRPPQATGIPVEHTPAFREAFQAASYLAKYDPLDMVPSEERKVFYSLCNR